MGLLLIDSYIQQKIDKVLEYAEQNPITMDMLLDTMNKDLLPVGEDGNLYSVSIPIGYRVVFSIELQPAGKCRHLSVSTAAPGMVPAIPTVQMIMKAFRFETPLEKCKVWMEAVNEGLEAVNIIELVN